MFFGCWDCSCVLGWKIFTTHQPIREPPPPEALPDFCDLSFHNALLDERPSLWPIPWGMVGIPDDDLPPCHLMAQNLVWRSKISKKNHPFIIWTLTMPPFFFCSLFLDLDIISSLLTIHHHFDDWFQVKGVSQQMEIVPLIWITCRT